MLRCCFCNKVINGYGNNPWPASKDPEARCCDYCNMDVVIPARIWAMKANKFADDVDDFDE